MSKFLITIIYFGILYYFNYWLIHSHIYSICRWNDNINRCLFSQIFIMFLLSPLIVTVIIIIICITITPLLELKNLLLQVKNIKHLKLLPFYVVKSPFVSLVYLILIFRYIVYNIYVFNYYLIESDNNYAICSSDTETIVLCSLIQSLLMIVILPIILIISFSSLLTYIGLVKQNLYNIEKKLLS